MTNTALEVRKQQLTTIQKFLDKAMPSLAAALPRIGLTPESLARTAFTTIVDSPALHGADPKTLVKCIIEAAQLGFSLDKNLGHAYLVPFKGKVQLMPGYQGYVALMDRSSLVRDVVVELVYDGDLFEYEINMERDILRWKPITKPAERTDEKITHAFAIVRLVNGGTRHRVLDIEDLFEARARSAAYQSQGKNSPWGTDFAAMCRKTALRRVAKISPLSPQMQRAVRHDDDVEAGRPQVIADEFLPDDVIDVLSEQASGGQKSTVETLREKAGTATPPTTTDACAPGCIHRGEPHPTCETAADEQAPLPGATAAAAPPSGPPSEEVKPKKRGRPKKDAAEAPAASGAVAPATESAPPPAQKPEPEPIKPTPPAQQRKVTRVDDEGSQLIPPKQRAKQFLNGDIEQLKKVSTKVLGYERESFEDLFEREAVAIVSHFMQQSK